MWPFTAVCEVPDPPAAARGHRHQSLCPEALGWTRFEKSCYRNLRVRTPYDAAARLCAELGGTLATIASPEENADPY